MNDDPLERQTMRCPEPVAEFKEVAEPIGAGEVVARLGVAVHGDSIFRDVHHGDFRDRRFHQHALFRAVWFIRPASQADFVADFRHAFRRWSHRLQLLAALNKPRELRLKHPHERRGTTRHAWQRGPVLSLIFHMVRELWEHRSGAPGHVPSHRRSAII
jgi:hypothetical protein